MSNTNDIDKNLNDDNVLTEQQIIDALNRLQSGEQGPLRDPDLQITASQVLGWAATAFVLGSAVGLALTRRPSKHLLRDTAHLQARLVRSRQLRDQHHRLFPNAPQIPSIESYDHVNLASPSEGLSIAVPAFVGATVLVGTCAACATLACQHFFGIQSLEELAQALHQHTPQFLSEHQKESVRVIEEELEIEKHRSSSH